MVPQVFSSVVYNTPSLPLSTLHTFIPALLHGYSRRRVRNADYPGILPTPTSSVFGTLVTGLTRANMAKLDYFEGDQYERRKVKVKVLDQVGDVKGEGNVEGEEVEAEVYVFLEVGELEEGEWDLEEFRREKLGKWTRAGFVFEGE